MLLFFAAENGGFAVMPFAASISIELHSDLTTEPSEDDFWVEVRYNGKLLEFDSCEVGDKCTY